MMDIFEKNLSDLNNKMRALKRIEMMAKYKKLKTDEERVIFTFNLMSEYDIIPNPTSMPKNANESKKQREIGNMDFKISKVDDHKSFSKSIAFAPYPSKELALAYADRSALLYKMDLHSECVQDIDRALALDYLEDYQRTELNVRKTKCLKILENSSAESVLKEAQHGLDKTSLNDTREELQAKLDTLRQKTSQTESDVQDTFEQAQTKKPSNELPLPTVASPNDEVPCASDAVAIRYDKHYGRHIVATRDIKPGEVIAVEKPYSLIPMQSSAQTHCSNCLKGCWANIPCIRCPSVMYCSEECRDTDRKRCHDVECAVFHLIQDNSNNTEQLLSIRLAILAVREANNIQELKAMLKEVDEHDDPRTKGFSKDGKLHSDKYIGIYSHMTHTEKRIVYHLFQMSFFASFISYLVATRTEMFGTTLPEDLTVLAKKENVTFFGSLIMRHLQIASCDRQFIYGARSRMGQDLRDLNATSFHSLMNHSCNPNVFRLLHRSKHVVTYAVYPIKKGEQLFDCYGPHYATTQKKSRKEVLLKQCYFDCDCIPCEKNWSLYEKLKSFETLVEEDTNKAKIKEALSKLSTYEDLVKKGNVQDKPNVIEDLLKMVQTLYDYAPMNCKEMHNVNLVLLWVYDWYGNRFMIPKIWGYQK